MARDIVGPALGWAIVLPLIVWDSRTAKPGRFRMLALIMVVYFIAIALTDVPHSYLHALRVGHWNWSGKTASAVFIYAAILAIPALRPARTYVTWRQRPGWIPGTLGALALLLAMQASIQFLYGGPESFSAETLAFQATLPGINEEPLWRALVLGCINTICLSRKRVFGADLGWAVIVSAVLFALAHALAFDHAWHLQFDSVTFGYVTAVGLILAYVAELTGSILLPILLHNIFNVAGHAWEMRPR